MGSVRAAVISSSQSIASDQPQGIIAASVCIEHLQHALNLRQEWYMAILETMAIWTLAEEDYKGRHYRYLIGGEAFDWLILAERLLLEVDDSEFQDASNNLLFLGRWPEELTYIQLRRILGVHKYRGYLNYWYGVVVEEALMLSVENEIRKENNLHTDMASDTISDLAFVRIYGNTEYRLWGHFCKGRGTSHKASISLDDMKEFTYWLFRWRLVTSDSARMASDTRKGLKQIQQLKDYSLKRPTLASGLLR
jgi:hypothetical protein